MAIAHRTTHVLLADLVSGPARAAEYRLVDVSNGPAVEFTFEKDGQQFVLWLRPSNADSASYRETVRFKIGYCAPPPDRLGYRLIDAVSERIAAWETSLAPSDYDGLFDTQAAGAAAGGDEPGAAFSRLNLDLEWLAVRSALKPVCRSVVAASAVDALLAEVRDAGLHARVLDAPGFVAGFCGSERTAATPVEAVTVLLYRARAAPAAAAAAAAEGAMIRHCSRGRPATDAQVRALGAALGYPPCCIEAFLPLRDRSNAAIRFTTLRRTTGAPAALLNDAVGRSLISHAPCAYDCAPSLAYADALLQRVAAIEPGAARSLRDSLAGLLVLFRDGGALRLAVTAAPGGAQAMALGGLELCTDGPHTAAWRAALSGADRVQVADDRLIAWRAGVEVARLPASPGAVQIRLFS
ncbi:MAG: hypothetical protein SF182_26490 [Deltaproteobacteria bacterium]|nr:hypothetical protein [Deltaproteobacteria bacterium]